MRTSLALLLLVGCRQTEITSDADASSAGSSCASIVASYDSLVASGGACSTDADCGCFNGGVSPKSACGGVTDHATATKLEKLRADFDGAKCRSGIACAAWSCTPKCSAGRCGNKP